MLSREQRRRSRALAGRRAARSARTRARYRPTDNGRQAEPGGPCTRRALDHDAIVVGAGHNGLVTAAYLARAGLRTLLLEARDVGGTAASEPFAGATVNICNCDHITFRTTPVTAELDLAAHGLRYIDIEPAQVGTAWSGGAGVDPLARRRAHARRARRDLPRRGRRVPALPAPRSPGRELLAAANEPPSIRGSRGSPSAAGWPACRRCCAGAGAAPPT